MSEKRLRWSKFWWQDWQSDKTLRAVSLGARGLWIEMLCIAHDGEPYGHVVINGRAPTTKMLSSIVGKSEKEVLPLLVELNEAGVYSVTDQGVIYSRRMVRDRQVSDQAAIDGKRGGNPVLKTEDKHTVKPNGDGGLTPPVKSPLKLQEAEAEEERKKEPPSPSGDGPPRPADVEQPIVKPKRAKPRTQIDPNWQPSDFDENFAVTRVANIPETVLRFRNHHIAKGSLMADWSAAWRTWCMNEPRFKNGPKPQQSRGKLDWMREELLSERNGKTIDGVLLQ